MLKPFDKNAFYNAVRGYKAVITIEEGFKNRAGLDSLVSSVLADRRANIELINFGIDDEYIFSSGSRDSLCQAHNLGENAIIEAVKSRKKDFA